MWSLKRATERLERGAQAALQPTQEALDDVKAALSTGNRLQRVLVALAVLALITPIVIVLTSGSGKSAPRRHAVVHMAFGATLAMGVVVPKRIANVPPPPPFSGPADGYCDARHRWSTNLDAADPVGPTFEISAPIGTAVDVVRANAHVFRSYKVKDGVSYIDCINPGILYDILPGTQLLLDLARPDVPARIQVEGSSIGPVRMPNAVINVGPGRTERVEVAAFGYGRVYEWALELKIVVDQRSETLLFGSQTQPLRTWLGPLPTPPSDYDPETHSWRRLASLTSEPVWERKFG